MSDLSDNDSDASTITVTYNEGKKGDDEAFEDVTVEPKLKPRNELPNGRRCHSALPWSLPDVTFRYDSWTDDSLNQEFYDPDETTEVWPCTVDVDSIAARMNTARKVVPIEEILEYGRDEHDSFMITRMHKDGYQLDKVVSGGGKVVFDVMRPQIATVVSRLASINISHNDLHPRNIIIDARFNIVAISGWLHSTDFNPEREYTTRALSQTEDHSWDHIFLKYVSDPLLPLFLNPVDGSFPPSGMELPSAIARTELSFEDRQLTIEPMPSLPDMKRDGYVRVVIMACDNLEIVTNLLHACVQGELAKASVELIVTDQTPLSEWTIPQHTPHIFSLKRLMTNYSNLFDERKNFSVVTSTVMGARPDVIVLLGWKHPLTREFWKATKLPRVIAETTYNTPVLFVTDTTIEEFPNSEDPISDYYYAYLRKRTVYSTTVWTTIDRTSGVKSSPICTFCDTLRRRDTLREFRNKILTNRVSALQDCIDALRDPRRPPGSGKGLLNWRSFANSDA